MISELGDIYIIGRRYNNNEVVEWRKRDNNEVVEWKMYDNNVWLNEEEC